MAFSNYHTHSRYCDGKMSPEDYVKKAVELGFDAIGFSSHAPLPFYNTYTLKETMVKEYCDEINNLKNKYKDKIEVYLGLEIDYIPEIMGPGSLKYKELNLDYTIGSVHNIYDSVTGDYLAVDDTIDELEKLIYGVFKGDVKEFVKRYYSLVRSMLEEHTMDIVGHLDLIKKYNKDNRYFNEEEEWYKEEVFETLRYIVKSGAVLEVNTGAISRGYMYTFYPSRWVLKECKRLNIPLVLSSDAHSPESINTYFEQSVSIMKEVGYESQRKLLNGKWIDVSFDV